MTTVLTYGTFDLFHIGHLRLIERLACRIVATIRALCAQPTHPTTRRCAARGGRSITTTMLPPSWAGIVTR